MSCDVRHVPHYALILNLIFIFPHLPIIIRGKDNSLISDGRISKKKRESTKTIFML